MADHNEQKQNENQHIRSNENEQPNIAPGMNTNDPLEEKAAPEEVKEGQSTNVSRLYLDRTPED